MFRELFEAKNIEVDVSGLQDQYGDGGEQEQDDFYHFIKTLEKAGMKNKDWSYIDDNTISVPAKYKKEMKYWNITIK